MSVVSAQGLVVAYGAQDVFSDISLSIAHGDRIGLIGPNGEGKTSLLRVIAGLQAPNAGTVHRRRGLHIGYLPQEPPPAGARTLYAAMLSVFAALQAQRAELARLEKAMADPAQREAALARYSGLQSAFEATGGYTYELRIQRVLSGLGFRPEEYDQPLAHLSGGQRTRALLAQLLLEEPDLLLLDEPTNHLDLEALEWLEGTLLKWPGSLVVVAHDRYFLDKVATRIWDMAFGRLEAYRGNYSHYALQRAERIERQHKEWEAQQEHIAKTEDFIRRYMAGQRSKEAQGRLKRLERFKRDEAIERPREAKRIRLDITTDVRSGNIVLRTKDLVVGYRGQEARCKMQETREDWHPASCILPPGSCVLFHSPDLEVLRQQRVALIGPNGSGKTTFLKTILGEVQPLAGRVRVGASVDIGYLAQMHAHLDPQKSVLDTILDEENMPLGQARSFLGRFLFSGDDVFKRVSDLSGGERSRVALACLTLRGANVLLLDEPTNHLDLASQEILEEVLLEFPGTILLVSHDRYLVDALATHVWALRDGRLHAYKGGYGAYLAAREQEKAAEAEEAKAIDAAQAQDWRERARAERRARREQEKHAERIATLEKRIEEQEARLAALEGELAAASQAREVTKVEELGWAYQQAEAQLQHLLDTWAELA
ncbi:MAG: ABC-F family ATP-binding cassette domain-containing protein [Chloroflexi bacterium]|nr:ABC-F family ATP-binding cassette domain-containing protein [Chloroflexota bacterium]